jgi:PAS domain S-box-containing protein
MYNGPACRPGHIIPDAMPPLPSVPTSGRGELENGRSMSDNTADIATLHDQYRVAIDTIPGLVWTSLPDGYVDFLNQRWLDYTGLTLEQAMGWGWQVAVCPADLPRLVTYWRSLLASGQPGEIEARLRRHDGVDRWFLFRGVPQHDERGQVVKWYGQTTDIEDRKRAEEELTRQTAHLDELFELAPHAVVLVDAAVRVMRVNKEFTRMFGYTPDEAVHRPLRDLVAPHERMEEYQHNARLLSSGRKVESETVRRRKDGVRLAVSMTASPVLTAGPIEGYIIYRDITERKRAEALLAGETRLLEMIAKGEPLTRTLEGLCRLVEQESPGAICSIMFLDDEGKRLRQGVAPSLPQAYTAALDGRAVGPEEGPCGLAAFRRETVIVDDFRTADLPADYRALAATHGLRACWSVPILARDRRVLGTFALYYHEPRIPTRPEHEIVEQFRDLASIAMERTEAENALRRSQEHLAKAQRLSLTGSFSWRPGVDSIIWSEETYRIYELDRAVTPTLALVRERVHPADRALFQQLAEAAVRDRQDFAFEHRLLFPDGSVKHLQITAHRASVDPEPLEFVGAVMDVTGRKRSEDALDRMRQDLAHVSRVSTLGQIAASIAHEINQPLAAIMINGNASLRWLAGDPPNLHEARDATRRIVRDGQRAGEVITRLRSLFRREGSPEERIAMNDVVHEVIAITRAEVQKGGAVIRTELADGLPPVTGDRVQLQQLVLNLIMNAVEAMSGVQDRRREIVIGTREGAVGDVVVAVRDSGVGLEPVGQDKIFDAFYTTKPTGMGMGLAISRSIAEHHGGRLWTESNDGPGARFLFTIPRNAAAADPSSQATEGPMCP